jgi:hypothetical protein
MGIQGYMGHILCSEEELDSPIVQHPVSELGILHQYIQRYKM